jgi:hypothetical protein
VAADSPIKGEDLQAAVFCCACAAIKRDLCANCVLGQRLMCLANDRFFEISPGGGESGAVRGRKSERKSFKRVEDFADPVFFTAVQNPTCAQFVFPLQPTRQRNGLGI